MHRALAVALLVLFSFPLATPLLSAGPEVQLPPCCRRDGKHACGMMAQKSKATPAGPSFADARLKTCPLFPTGDSAPALAKYQAAAPSALLLPPPQDVAPLAAAIESGPAVLFPSTVQKRGPPAFAPV